MIIHVMYINILTQVHNYNYQIILTRARDQIQLLILITELYINLR